MCRVLSFVVVWTSRVSFVFFVLRHVFLRVRSPNALGMPQRLLVNATSRIYNRVEQAKSCRRQHSVITQFTCNTGQLFSTIVHHENRGSRDFVLQVCKIPENQLLFVSLLFNMHESMWKREMALVLFVSNTTNLELVSLLFFVSFVFFAVAIMARTTHPAFFCYPQTYMVVRRDGRHGRSQGAGCLLFA